MEIPFPGMDPFLERASLWPDLHAGLITGMRDALQRRLDPKYVAVITPYITVESIDISPFRQMFIPDVAILGQAEPDDAGAVTTIAAAPLTLPATTSVPTRYARIEIRSVTNDVLVTSIELLSPANKRPGQDGVDAYVKKRSELYASNIHLLEINLLRGGVRPSLVSPLPDKPYFVFVSRAYTRPMVDVWRIDLHEALPVVPVPLIRPDPDVPLNLPRILRRVYRNARYERQVNYRDAPPLPALPPDDAAWVDAQLRERGLRSPAQEPTH